MLYPYVHERGCCCKNTCDQDLNYTYAQAHQKRIWAIKCLNVRLIKVF